MDRDVPAKLKDFTPVLDRMILEVGAMAALVYGRIWRYTQMQDRVCHASLEKIGKQLGLSWPTIHKHVISLVIKGYLDDLTPDLKGRPHTYAITGKAEIEITIGATYKDSLGVDDRPTYKESLGVDEEPIKNFNSTYKESLYKETSKRQELRNKGAGKPPPSPDETPIQEQTLTSPEWQPIPGQTVKNPKALAALQACEERQRGGEVDLGWVIESLRPLAQAFIASSGFKPIKRDHSLWRKILFEWQELGLSEYDIIETVQKMRKDGLDMSGPQSVTNLARNAKAKRKEADGINSNNMQPGESALDWIKRVEQSEMRI